MGDTYGVLHPHGAPDLEWITPNGACVLCARESHAAELAALRKRVEQLEAEGIVKLCVCVNGDNPASDCPCVICTVRRAEARAEKAERERDSYRRDFDAAAHACDKLQADLDAALGDKEVAERHYQTMLDRLRDENENLRVDRRRALALLEKRRESK